MKADSDHALIVTRVAPGEGRVTAGANATAASMSGQRCGGDICMPSSHDPVSREKPRTEDLEGSSLFWPKAG